nr:HLA class II histocompatibility antigen, DR alpha chain-like [Loxodonta africana]
MYVSHALGSSSSLSLHSHPNTLSCHFRGACDHPGRVLSEPQSAEFMLDFDGDEFFYVNMEQKETVWWLKEFEHFASFEAQRVLASIAVDKVNLDVVMKRSNHTPNISESPAGTLLLSSPAEFLQLNILISFVDTFSPPILNVPWLKNIKPVITEVSETVFLSITASCIFVLPFPTIILPPCNASGKDPIGSFLCHGIF